MVARVILRNSANASALSLQVCIPPLPPSTFHSPESRCFPPPACPSRPSSPSPACPSHAKWVVVTNGDNTYDPTFLEEVLAAPPDSDVVAVDFYSRYQRPTGQ